MIFVNNTNERLVMILGTFETIILIMFVAAAIGWH